MPKEVLGGKFGRIAFSADIGPACCGHLIVYDFQIRSTHVRDWGSNNLIPQPSFETQEDQLEDFRVSLENVIRSRTADWFNEEGVDEDDHPSSCYAFISATLIKNNGHGNEQIPGLIDAMLNDGWQVDQEGVNPKTSNLIVHLSKKV